MIVRFGKIHTLTRDTHTYTRCLCRRIQLVGNIGLPWIIQNIFILTVHIHLQYLQFIYIFNTYSSYMSHPKTDNGGIRFGVEDVMYSITTMKISKLATTSSIALII